MPDRSDFSRQIYFLFISNLCLLSTNSLTLLFMIIGHSSAREHRRERWRRRPQDRREHIHVPPPWWPLPTCRYTPRQVVPNTNEDAFCYTSYNPLTLSFSGCIETLVLQTSNDQIFSHSNNSNLTSASGFLDVITKLTSLKFLQSNNVCSSGLWNRSVFCRFPPDNILIFQGIATLDAKIKPNCWLKPFPLLNINNHWYCV